MTSILIAGITGHQGQEVAKAHLAKGHQVYGITRNKNSKASVQLKKQGCCLYQGDLNSPESLLDLPSCHILFVVTDFWAGKQNEVLHACHLINAAKDKVDHIIFSSTVTSKWGNTFSHSDSKHMIENYLKKNVASYTILRLGFFMELFKLRDFAPPVTLGMMKKNISPNISLPFTNLTDMAKMVLQISQNPQKYAQKELSLISDQMTLQKYIDTYQKQKGKKPFYFSIPNMLFAHFVSKDLIHMWQWFKNNQHPFTPSEEFKAIQPQTIAEWLS